MPRNFKFLRRNSGKDQDVEEIENVPINPNDLSSIQALNPKPSVEQVGSVKRKCEWTPVNARSKMLDTATLPVSTPERPGTGNVGRKRLALASAHEYHDAGQSQMANYFSQSVSTRNGSSLNLTPRVGGTAGRAYRGHSERDCASTQNTPAKSVSKPPNPGFAPFSSLRHPGSARAGNYAALSRSFSVSSGQLCTVNTVEVPHFDLKEDPTFWMDHNVQVIIRVRPLNSFEISTHGYNRCVKQENAQSITWIGQPETRFTFDHVACETVEQEMLFRMSGLPMVENCLSGYNSCMFAYGQTGSGKTYTMLGEMEDLEFKPSSHRGMTPRIFEFLFARISAEEESRRDEKLKYSCKCSFLEIYNEQIADLLDPTSTNLLIREDVKKGVYVENLSEFEVCSVSDVLRLLIQGSSNRKVAATDMNRESSRSHSVFTCVVESKWERDSTTNLRFARLNLVDLAGSERQKSSGAEGERLKEAANINKSLSTLGHVIMLLVDIAQGKPKHVPCRDSRLTFLLQDSLGGNSKTMIIANISPSICCAAETLNTLKFAQRAKLIQNNAVVNEDSSGDVAALQHQIWLLREELSSLKRQNVSRRLAFDPFSTMGEQENTDTEIRSKHDEVKADNLMLKSMEKMLAGALRREQIAEASIKELKAEIEQLNLLVHQREEDTKCTKMMLKFREDKIKRMEALLGDLKPLDAYLLEENAYLSEEIQLLRSKFDKNPEVTRFASENIRLQEQLRRFQDFYEEGERDILMKEISELRSQLIHFFDNNKHQHDPNMDQVSTHNIEGNGSVHSELTDSLKELTECRIELKSSSERNAKLSREIEDLHALLRNKKTDMNDHHGIVKAVKDTEVPCVVDQVFGADKCRSKHVMATNVEEILNLELELDILKIMLKEERLSRGKMEEMIASLIQDAELAEERLLFVSLQSDGAKRDLKEAKSVIEALESQQLLSINEIEDLKNCNDHYLELLHKQELEISALKEQTVRSRYARFRPSELKESPLQVQLKRMQASLDKAKNLNMWYQNDHDAQRTNEEEMDNIRQQVEAETAYVIVSLQEELSMLQHRVQESDMKEREAENKLLILESNLKELQETLDTMSQDNELLNQNLQEKDIEIRSLKEDWEILSSEIEGALFEGHETLGNVCDQVDSFSCPLSDKRVWVSEQTGRMIRDISEKESIIQELNRCLEDANVRGNDMEHMLLSLRGAAIVLTESHEQDCCEKEEEIVQLRSELSRKTYAIVELEQRLKLGYDEVRKASTCATAAFVVVNRLSEINSSHLDAFRVMDIQLRELQEMHQKKDGSPFEKSAAFKEAQRKIEPLEASCNNCISLRQQLHKQQRYISTLERRFMENDKSAFGKTLKILEDYEMEVSMGRPTMDDCAEHIGYPERNSCHGIMLFNRFCGALQRPRTATGYEIHEVDSSLAVQLGAGASNTVLRSGENRALVAHDSSEVINIFDNSSKIDTSVILLGNEIGSAVGSLKETQAEIAHLSDVKKEIYLSEGKACEDIEAALETQVLSIQAAFGEFEKQCESKTLILNHKLHIVDECAQEAKSSWSRTKELHKSELVDAKSTMDQQTAEFFSLLAEFEEAQDKMKEADVMINELTVTNEKMKLETENMKKANIMLTTERDSLITEVQELQSSYALRDQNYKNLEEQFEWSVSNITSLVEDLVRSASEAEGTYQEALTSIVHNFNSLKSQIQDVLKWMHLSFEEISLEILAKDCALSVSYICHIGILLDAIIGLQPENSLLHVGIRESDAVICNLRENNMKSEEELQKCQMLDSKLSADIWNNLFCLSSKESETRELSMKLSSFKEKSEILRHQEELMLERSNIMGSELAVSTEKLDQSNSTVTVSLLEQERLLKFSNEEDMKSQVEIFMLELAAKDFQLLNLVSELQQLAHRNADMEKEHLVCCSALDYLVADVVTLRIVVDLRKELFSERETQIICLQIEVEEAKDGEAKVLNQLHKLEEEYVTLKESLNMKEKENESFKNKLQEMESSNCYLLEDIQEKNLESNSVMGCIDMLKLQNCRLEVDISNLESRIALLEKDLKLKKTKLDDTSETLSKRSQDLENCRVKMNAVQDENLILTDELLHLRQSYCELLRTSTSKVVKCIYSVGTADVQSCSMLEQLDENLKMLLDKISHDACQNLDVVSVFLQELEFLDSNVKGLVSEKLSLQEQLSRKDEVLNGLLFDLRLLRENAANNKDQMDEIGKLAATLKSAEDELAIRSSELDDAIANGQNLGVKLKEQTDMITTLEMDLEKANNSLKLLSDENMGLGSHIDVIMAARASVEQELTEKRRVVDGLEKELLEMTLGQMNDLVESLKSNLVEVSGEKDQLQKEVMALEEKVGTALALAKENETIAAESQEVAESRRIYAEEKEEEVKLLESSVLELGSTIAALEKKVDILKKEAERQQTKREALESELHSLKSQMHHIESADDIKRHLDEKAKNLQEALEHLEIVEEDLLKKDREIAQCKTHIAELTVQAEGQASRLCRAESFLLRVMEELVQYRVSNGISSSITFDEVQRLNKKLKGTEKDKLRLVETLLGLFANFSKAAGGTISISKSNDYASEEALKQSGVSGDET